MHPAAGGVDDPPRGPLELWVADAATGKARKLLGGLNTVFDECALLCLTAVAAERHVTVPCGSGDMDVMAGRLVESV